jgi:hypothetical protein
MTDYEAFKLHAVLYAKSHYKEDRKMTGLRIIAGHYAGVEPKYVDDEHLLHFTMKLLEDFSPTTSVKDIVFGTFKDCWMWRPRSKSSLFPRINNITRRDIIQSILMVLRHLRVDQLPPLPKADPKIYPLRKK